MIDTTSKRKEKTKQIQNLHPRRTSMLFTAGLLSRFRCRCALPAGDLAAAAAHDRQTTATTTTSHPTPPPPRAVAMCGSRLLTPPPLLPPQIALHPHPLPSSSPTNSLRRRCPRRRRPRADLRNSKQCGGCSSSSGWVGAGFLGGSSSSATAAAATRIQVGSEAKTHTHSLSLSFISFRRLRALFLGLMDWTKMPSMIRKLLRVPGIPRQDHG